MDERTTTSGPSSMTPLDGSQLVVRPATVDDIPGTVALYAAVAAEGRWIGREGPLDEAQIRERWGATIGADGHLNTVAEIPGRFTARADPPPYGDQVGYLHLGLEPYGVAELGMHVARDVRGRGVGRAMLDDAIAWARAEPSVHKIALQVWPHNEAAIGLYRSCGFEQEGYLHRHYRRRSGELWDALVMGLLL
jgi:RimJ/RimL family protein N-acetyltransferase